MFQNRTTLVKNATDNQQSRRTLMLFPTPSMIDGQGLLPIANASKASHDNTVGNDQPDEYGEFLRHMSGKNAFKRFVYDNYQRGNNHQLNDDT